MMERLKRFGPIDKSDVSLLKKRAYNVDRCPEEIDHFSSVKEEGKISFLQESIKLILMNSVISTGKE